MEGIDTWDVDEKVWNKGYGYIKVWMHRCKGVVNMKCGDVVLAIRRIASVMEENCDYLSELDARNGDGDLGITMNTGFHAAAEAMEMARTEDFGQLFLAGSRAFNRSAPSTLGTILSFGMMGMAKELKGKTEIGLRELAGSMEAGLCLIMEKAGSKPGEKTILDALVPAVEALKEAAAGELNKKAEFQDETAKKKWEFVADPWKKAAEAARKGMESTKTMRPVHGRAAYYGEKSMGLEDGGAVAGMLIVESIAKKWTE